MLKINSMLFKKLTVLLSVAVFLIVLTPIADAAHSWGPYHWARTSNPFNLKIGKNVASVWNTYLTEASSDWNLSSVLKTSVVAGKAGNPRTCRATTGQVEVCSAKYGLNGWLGVASIWVNGNHITRGTVKLNDTYFSTPTYNKPEWRRLVMCQEIGHTFGLDHQDENFSNLNLGTCMDYTSNPLGPLSNEHPNAHDYEQLETIYAHLDAVTTVAPASIAKNNAKNRDQNSEEVPDWGKTLRKSASGKSSLYGKDLGKNEKVFTFVLWVE